MNILRNPEFITLRIALPLPLAVTGELLLFVHLLLVFTGEDAGLKPFLQVFLLVAGAYAAYSFALLPNDKEYGYVRAALIANPAATDVFAGLAMIFSGVRVASVTFAVAGAAAFGAGLLFLIRYYRSKGHDVQNPSSGS